MGDQAICIDCSPLLVRSAGVKTYLYHWLRAMQRIRPESLRSFLAPGNLDELDHNGGILVHPREIAMLLALNMIPAKLADFVFPRCDVFHISNLIRAIPRLPRLTTTVHDLTSWILPHCHTPANVAGDKAFADRVFKRADGLIAVSENTKRDAVRILGLPPAKIQVIYLGVPAPYWSVAPKSVTNVLKALALKKSYFLFVGTIEPRKNVETLLDAWEALPASFRAEYDLIVSGMPGWQSEKTIIRLAQANRDNAGIRYLGYVPESEMPALTAGATCFVYPSLYEGFGIPVAQAMAAGCSVITSNISSLPEITNGAAVLIDPLSVSELSLAIQRVAESEDLRVRLVSLGRKRAQIYTWENAATQSLRFFAEIC